MPHIDLPKEIRRAVAECKVMLVVIGPNWQRLINSEGIRRLDDPRDFVRLEIEAALVRQTPVIPILVNHAQMPREQELPQSLRPIAFRNSFEIRRDPFFQRDIESLIQSLDRHLSQDGVQSATARERSPETSTTPNTNPNLTEDISDFRLILESFCSEEVDPQLTREKLVNVYGALNRYSLAKYGRRLTLEGFRQYVLANSPVEV